MKQSYKLHYKMKVGFTLLRVKQLLSIFVKPIMDKYYKYLEEQNKQLKFLLEFEMMERRQIAGDFHGKAAGMFRCKCDRYVHAV